ncbi:MAG: hypothetical protein ACXWLH_03775 [Candidatus Saccharimonadales bacterium]
MLELVDYKASPAVLFFANTQTELFDESFDSSQHNSDLLILE